MNIGDRVGFLFFDGPQSGTLVDYNPLRKVWIVESDLLLDRNFPEDKWIDLPEDEIMEMVAG